MVMVDDCVQSWMDQHTCKTETGGYEFTVCQLVWPKSVISQSVLFGCSAQGKAAFFACLDNPRFTQIRDFLRAIQRHAR